MGETDRIIENCSECEICTDECEFLKEVGQTPKEIAQRFSAAHSEEDSLIPYFCTICSLCQELCPEDLNIGKMCLEIREQLINDGLAPPHTRSIIKGQDWIASNFTLVQPDPEITECRRVFFPGCILSGYSPSLVMKVYDYLREKLPGTGIILGCCGSPLHELGEEPQFQGILRKLESEMRRLGTSEMIVACPYCYYTLKRYAGQLQLDSLYEVMVDLGLPEPVNHHEWTFSLHDSCRARWEKNLQDSIRTLVSRMGYRIEELEYSRDKTRCCGMGGLVGFINFPLARKIIRYRTDEASFDMLTYCATCREAFAIEKPSVHILDLIFNPDWQKDRLKPPKMPKVRQENQAQLKQMLETRVPMESGQKGGDYNGG